MPDRDKVIKEFADYVKYFKPYCIGDVEDHEMLKDVLELLKEQEPPSYEQLKDPSHYGKMYKCRKCGMEWYQQTQKYCQECGTAVKWE